MMRKFKFAALLFVAVIIFNVPVFAQEADTAANFSIMLKIGDATAKVGDKDVTLDAPATLIDNRTVVPVRFIGEAFGAEIGWNDETRTVTIKYANKTVVLTIDSNNATINEKNVALDVAAQTINDRTMVPIRFISEAFDATVDWNGETETAIISGTAQSTVATPAYSSEGLYASADQSVGLIFVIGTNPEGENYIETRTIEGETALFVNAKKYLYVKFKDADIKVNGNATIKITYLDKTAGSLAINYSSSSTDPSVKNPVYRLKSFTKPGTGGWKLAEFKLDDAKFEHLQNNKAEFRIIGGAQCYIKSVELIYK